jgi:hypothetical protein
LDSAAYSIANSIIVAIITAAFNIVIIANTIIAVAVVTAAIIIVESAAS